MDRWNKLYQRMAQANQAREHERAQREADVESRLDAWSSRVTSEVMEALHARALQRARTFQQQTGAAVAVTYPSEEIPRQAVAPADAELTFMKLSLDEASIYVYSARSPSKLPSLHVASAAEQIRPGREPNGPASSSPMRRRMMSRPICRIGRGDDNGYELRSTDSKLTLELDGIVYSAFEQLVQDWRRLAKPESLK